MSSRTEKKALSPRTHHPSACFQRSGPDAFRLATLFFLASLALPACRSAEPVQPAREWHLTGRWVIDYGRSARSILESRGMTADPARLNLAEAQLRQRFYGEFQFTETGTYSILHKLQGKEKKDHGSFTIREQKGARFLVAARSEPADPKAPSSGEESFSIEFLEPDLIRLEKDDDRELPPLILQREEVKP